MQTHHVSACRRMGGPQSVDRSSCPSQRLHARQRLMGQRHSSHNTHDHGRAGSVAAAALRCFTGSMPMVGFEQAPVPIAVAVQQHEFVVVEQALAQGNSYLLMDFLPLQPTHPATAATLLSGGSVPGHVRARLMQRLIQGPAISTHYHSDVLAVHGQDLQALQLSLDQFNAAWNTDLSLLKNDCHHYAAALVKRLTGQTMERRGWRRLLS